jgi:hypothetical protein
MLDDGLILAGFRAETALDAKAGVDLATSIWSERNRIPWAGLLASMRQAATASGGNFHSAERALVASRFDDLDDIWVLFVSANS